MYSLDNLLDELREAVRNSDLAAVGQAVRHAIHERPLVPEVGSSKLLHSEPGLTVLHIAVNPGFVSPPHDHRTWAVVGVYSGQEDNTFYRLIDGSRRIERFGSRDLIEGEVLTLKTDAIHRIANPRTDKLVALHVYGRNIFEFERSSWDLTTGEEQPFELRLDASGTVRS
jgi:predicted metal-dependent enzyme (double-stranded beta helix superfamily)